MVKQDRASVNGVMKHVESRCSIEIHSLFFEAPKTHSLGGRHERSNHVWGAGRQRLQYDRTAIVIKRAATKRIDYDMYSPRVCLVFRAMVIGRTRRAKFFGNGRTLNVCVAWLQRCRCARIDRSYFIVVWSCTDLCTTIRRTRTI
jgi:hypothetical protein